MPTWSVLAQTIINRGFYGKARVPEPDVGRCVAAQRERGVPRQLAWAGLRPVREVSTWMLLFWPTTAGRTGYTGDVDPDHREVEVVRQSCSPTGCTRAATGAATTSPRRTPLATWRWPSRSSRSTGPTSWFSGVGDARTATVARRLPASLARLALVPAELRPLVRHRTDGHRDAGVVVGPRQQSG